MSRTWIFGMYALWPLPLRYDLGSKSWHAHWSWKTIVDLMLSRSNMATRSNGPDTDFRYMCNVTLTLAIWPWTMVMTHPWVMDKNCVLYDILCKLIIVILPIKYAQKKIVWNIIKIQYGSQELWPWHAFWLCVHIDLDLGDMTLVQGLHTSLGHRQ